MSQPQKNVTMKPDSPEWVVIADDWVDIDDNMDDIDHDDDFDQAKSKNELSDHVTSDQAKSKNESHDHVTSHVNADNKNISSGPKVMTRYIDVPEELVKFFAGKDVVMDLQITSGAMIQVTEVSKVDGKGKCRPVRLIGNLENVEKAEKLIKAVVALNDAGGTVLLRKHDSDTNDYGTKYGHYQKQEPYQSRNYSEYPESWGPFKFDRKRSHKRTHDTSLISQILQGSSPTGGECCNRFGYGARRPFQS